MPPAARVGGAFGELQAVSESDRLSQNFSIREAMESQTAREHGIDNTPPIDVLPALIMTAIGLERIRAFLGNYPVKIHSWYRSERLNRAVGGAKDSQHLLGCAVDFSVPKFGGPKNVANMLDIMKRDFKIDQLILEPSWVHCSFAEKPRGQSLTAAMENGRRVYLPGIVLA